MTPTTQAQEATSALPSADPNAIRDYHVVIAKVAAMKDVDVDKLERLMQMQEQWEARAAATRFNELKAQAEAEMQPISKDMANPSTKSKYASLAAILEAIKPI